VEYNYNYINDLKQRIESMRAELNNKISSSLSIKGDDVMEISLQLDELISEYLKLTIKDFNDNIGR